MTLNSVSSTTLNLCQAWTSNTSMPRGSCRSNGWIRQDFMPTTWQSTTPRRCTAWRHRRMSSWSRLPAYHAAALRTVRLCPTPAPPGASHEEISMLDNLSGGRMEIGVGRGVLEAYFWGQDADVEVNYPRYLETLAILREGLGHGELTYHGQFYDFVDLPMRMRPKQTPPASLVYAQYRDRSTPWDARHARCLAGRI